MPYSKFLLLAVLLLALFRLPWPRPEHAQTPSGDKGKNSEQSSGTRFCSRSRVTAGTRPAYHSQPPTGELPATLPPPLFLNNKAAFVAYSIAAKIPELLYQEPCYCECDDFEGHQSLLDCYTSRHGVGCEKCQAEVFFIYEQSRVGKTAAEIREAMANGDYRKIDIAKYADDHYADFRRFVP
jgi:Protein of unknown function with PCYCGC motif